VRDILELRRLSSELPATSRARAGTAREGSLLCQTDLRCGRKTPAALQNRLRRTENSPGDHHPGRVAAKYAPASRARVLERSSVPNPDQHPTTAPVDPGRLRLILHRLQNDYYAVPPASEQIAASVLAELNDVKEGPPALPY
jgi:hypothetical protein